MKLFDRLVEQVNRSQKKKSFVVFCTRLEEMVGSLEDLNKAQVTKEKPNYQGPFCFCYGRRGNFGSFSVNKSCHY